MQQVCHPDGSGISVSSTKKEVVPSFYRYICGGFWELTEHITSSLNQSITENSLNRFDEYHT